MFASLGRDDALGEDAQASLEAARRSAEEAAAARKEEIKSTIDPELHKRYRSIVGALLFIAITVCDKLGFFLVWALVQAAIIRRFIEPVPTWDVFRMKGGAELIRIVNNSLADAGFLYGVAQLTHARVAAVVIVANLPFFCHFLVLLVQASQ